MSPIAVRGRIHRWRRHAAGVVLIIILAGSIAVHHAAPALSDPHHAAGIAAIAELCLGVLTVVGVAAAVAAAALRRIGRWHPRALVAAGERWPSRMPELRARAGPAALVLLCVSRR